MGMEKKVVTRIAITYSPPTFKFEFTKGRRRDKYHKHIFLEKYLDTSLCGSTEMTVNAMSIVTAISDRHEALRQVPEETMEQAIETLLTMYKPKKDSDRYGVVLEPSEASAACLPDNAHATPESTAFTETDGRMERYENFNEVSEEELSMAKNRMTVTFEKSVILPDNDRFEYDKRIDFHPNEDSSWDLFMGLGRR